MVRFSMGRSGRCFMKWTYTATASTWHVVFAASVDIILYALRAIHVVRPARRVGECSMAGKVYVVCLISESRLVDVGCRPCCCLPKLRSMLASSDFNLSHVLRHRIRQPSYQAKHRLGSHEDGDTHTRGLLAFHALYQHAEARGIMLPSRSIRGTWPEQLLDGTRQSTHAQ